MKIAVALLVASVASLLLATCAREDGNPDPSPQGLVECSPDAGPDDPLACPPSNADAGVDAP